MSSFAQWFVTTLLIPVPDPDMERCARDVLGAYDECTMTGNSL